MNEKTPHFDDFWFPVEGMENVHELMNTFADISAQRLVEQARSGESFMIASFMNGGMCPLIYTFARLKTMEGEGLITHEEFSLIANSTALFEAPKDDRTGDRYLIPSPRYMDACQGGNQLLINPQRVIAIDDIFETTNTIKALIKAYPRQSLTLISPVIKHCSLTNLGEISYEELLFAKKVDDNWIDTGAGLNGGIEFEDLSVYLNNLVNVLQRYANVGYWHDASVNVAPYGQIHEDRIQNEQLPWLAASPVFQDLILLETLKRNERTSAQLDIADHILDTVCKFTPEQAAQLLRMPSEFPSHQFLT